MQYFNYDWFNTFTVHVQYFLLFMKSNFTTNAQIVIHLNQRTHGHNSSWSVSRSLRPRGVTNGLKT